jgi:hypothetical protein
MIIKDALYELYCLQRLWLENTINFTPYNLSAEDILAAKMVEDKIDRALKLTEKQLMFLMEWTTETRKKRGVFGEN